MAQTIREKILAAAGSKLEEISSLNSVIVQRFTALDISRHKLPAVFLFAGSETRSEEVTAYETWEMEMIVELWAKADALEETAGLIHKKLYEDRTLSGNCLDLHRVSMDVAEIDPSKNIGAVMMTFTVLYRHEAGNPF